MILRTRGEIERKRKAIESGSKRAGKEIVYFDKALRHYREVAKQKPSSPFIHPEKTKC